MNTDGQIKDLALVQNLGPRAIASALGMNAEYVRSRLRAMNVQPGTQNYSLFGLSNNSYNLRAKLGLIINELIENHLQPEVSAMTGLNRREIGVARQHPYNHDWKLSQIERTLNTVNSNVKEYL